MGNIAASWAVGTSHRGCRSRPPVGRNAEREFSSNVRPPRGTVDVRICVESIRDSSPRVRLTGRPRKAQQSAYFDPADRGQVSPSRRRCDEVAAHVAQPFHGPGRPSAPVHRGPGAGRSARANLGPGAGRSARANLGPGTRSGGALRDRGAPAGAPGRPTGLHRRAGDGSRPLGPRARADAGSRLVPSG